MFEIGNSLREARMRHQLDFAAAEQATKIRSKYLRALEDEQFDQLPAQTYVKGFLRAYADYLGLDGQLYVDEYNSRYTSGEEVLERRVHTTRVRQPRRGRRLQTNMVWLAIVAIGLVTALVFVAWKFGGGQKESLPLQQKPSQTQRHQSAGLLIQVKKKARGNSWLVVRRGSETGKLLYQGTLERGQSIRFATGRVWLNVGSPENVTMRLNGRPVLVGGDKPRSLIVTADDIYPAGPGT